jgi:hypothetical protein
MQHNLPIEKPGLLEVRHDQLQDTLIFSIDEMNNWFTAKHLPNL